MRNWIGLLMAAIMLAGAGAPSVAAARPVAGERTGIETWAVELMALTGEVADAVLVFDAWADGTGEIDGPDEAAAFAKKVLPTFHAARTKLRATRDRLDALQPYKGSDPYENELSVKLLKESREYAKRIDEVLASCETLMLAIIDKDVERVETAMAEVQQASVVLVEGQLVMVRGRQALFDRDDPNRYILGSMENLYEGMRAALYLSFETVSERQAVRSMRSAARLCRERVEAGLRAADRAAAEPGFVRGSDRYIRQQLAVGGDIAKALDEAASIYERSDDRDAAFETVMNMFTALEERYDASIRAEIALPET
jgi:hypothetical protein